MPRQLKLAGWAIVKVAASDLAQLALANILNNRKCITGREGLSEGFVEPVIRKLPFRTLHSRFRRTGFSLILGQTLYDWPVVSDIHGCLPYSNLSSDQKLKRTVTSVDELNWRGAREKRALLSLSCALGSDLSAALEEEPGSLFRFVNPVLQQACGGHIPCLVA